MLGGKFMKKAPVLLILICLLITACNSKNSITTFEGTIESIDEGKFLVSCSHEEIKDKKGNINGRGYFCSITINNTTKLVDSKGASLQFNDFSNGDSIQIKFSKPQKITENNRQFDATKIVLLDAQQ